MQRQVINDNVKSPLNKIKESSHSTTEVQCEFWSPMANLNKLISAQQFEGETIPSHCKQFKNVVEIVEGQWGDFCLIKTVKMDDEHDDDTKRSSFFKNGANWKCHGKCVDE